MLKQLLLASIFLPSCVHSQTRSAGDIYKQAGPAVVLIEDYGDDGKISATGSGFLVSADGRILTNFHVIAHTKRATVRLANEDAYDAFTFLLWTRGKISRF
jgi:S1-C subfamily serine protease